MKDYRDKQNKYGILKGVYGKLFSASVVAFVGDAEAADFR